MADQSDVEDALASMVATALYPDGIDATSVPGMDCRVYRGWPSSAALDADLAGGKVNVTIFPSGTGRTTTRYGEQWTGLPAHPSLTTTVSGTWVTFGGSADAGQIAGILIDGQSYAYRTREGDTPGLVAANLAALARSNGIVHLSGDSLAVAGASNVLARVVADASVQQELRRQEQDFRVTCWCPSPLARDAAAAAIDVFLSSNRFVALADGTSGRLTYVGTTVFDQSQNARLYRRDLIYSVEYITTISMSLPAMLFGNVALNEVRFTS